MNAEGADSPPPTPDQSRSDLSASPRAFVTATGYVMQGVGLVLVLGSCGIWPLLAKLERPAGPPPGQWREFLSGASLPAALITLAAFNSVVGGIGLIAAGVGLQGERKRSGRIAIAICSVVTAVYVVLGTLLIARTDAWGYSLLCVAGTALTGIMLLLAAHSSTVLSAHPPPADDSRLTQEVLEEYRRARDERRKQFDL